MSDEEYNLIVVDSTVIFSGDIYPAAVSNLQSKLLKLESEKNSSTDKKVTLLFTSNGGRASEGLKLRDFLHQLNLELIIVAEGQVYSAGTFVLCTKHQTYARENTTFLIHDIWYSSGTTLESHRQEVKHADLLITKMLALYNSRTKKPITKDMLTVNWYFDTNEAIELGLVDGVYNA
jgi:ATP-dependent protease ClpP protease subunit